MALELACPAVLPPNEDDPYEYRCTKTDPHVYPHECRPNSDDVPIAIWCSCPECEAASAPVAK